MLEAEFLDAKISTATRECQHLGNIIPIPELVAIYLDAKIVIVTTERHTTHNQAFGLLMYLD